MGQQLLNFTDQRPIVIGFGEHSVFGQLLPPAIQSTEQDQRRIAGPRFHRVLILHRFLFRRFAFQIQHDQAGMVLPSQLKSLPGTGCLQDLHAAKFQNRSQHVPHIAGSIHNEHAETAGFPQCGVLALAYTQWSNLRVLVCRASDAPGIRCFGFLPNREGAQDSRRAASCQKRKPVRLELLATGRGRPGAARIPLGWRLHERCGLHSSENPGTILVMATTPEYQHLTTTEPKMTTETCRDSMGQPTAAGTAIDCQWRILPAIILFAFWLPANAAVSVEPRTYAQGPLTGADFLAEVPQGNTVPVGGLRALAYASTEMLFDYRYRVMAQNGVWTARLSEIRVVAVLWREKSWNRHPDDRKLMDHEQGHFDLAQMWALRGQKELSDALRRGDLQGQGESPQAAVKAFETALDRRVQKFRDALTAADRSYDQLTRYGTLAEQQAAHRKSQMEAIQQLAP